MNSRPVKHISIVTPCFNEEDNVLDLYQTVKAIFSKLPQYTYEHIFIDNASRDRTAVILRDMAARDPNVKVILNNRNFGPVRSPYYGMLQGYGDAVIQVVCDFQEPPSLIPRFLELWEGGEKLVLGIKTNSDENGLFYLIRSLYYKVLNRISDTDLVQHTTGFGLYDQSIIQAFRNLDERYPYLRGLISELGYHAAEVPYHQPARKRGISQANFFVLYDWAMLGLTTHSKMPIRLACIMGFSMSLIFMAIGFVYLVYKLIYWQSFSLGTAPMIIGFSFFASVQLLFIGLIGEYVGAILTQVRNLPLVTELERINFNVPSDRPEQLLSPS